jgi:protease PrsW
MVVDAQPGGRLADIAVGPRARRRDRRQWLRVFLGGLLLWAATVVVTFWTSNANLVPTIILLGSFLVPATFVVDAFEHHAIRS